jgi:hypothetical protein
MDWNEFNRELQKRVSDPGLRYILGMIYERLLDVANQQEANMSVTVALAETMQNFVSLNDLMMEDVKKLNKIVKGERDGVELRSVPLTNEDR